MSSSTPDPLNSPAGLVIEARAKVNLCLRALSRLADGYTEIITLFQSISLTDQVTLRGRGDGISLACDDPSLPTGPENLAYRAAALFFEQTGIPGGVDLHLAKRIPVAAGLGGGSSDAAAVLRGLNLLHGGLLPEDDLWNLAARLGSDVPFFLLGGTALGKGRGEILESLPDLPPLPLIIVWPGMGVSAADAYRMLPPLPSSRPVGDPLTGEGPELTIILRRLGKRDIPGAATYLVNDLEAGVLRAHPEVRAAREALAGTGAAAVMMTGSGSACHGLYGTEEEAQEAQRRLVLRPGWKLFRASFSPRSISHWGVVKR